MPAPSNSSVPIEDTGRDWLGWLCLLVILPPLWLGAPLVLTVIAVRSVFFNRGGTPSAVAALASFVICLFWVWFVWVLLGGAHP